MAALTGVCLTRARPSGDRVEKMTRDARSLLRPGQRGRMTSTMHGLERFAALALALCLAGCRGSEETLPRTGPAESPTAASTPAPSASAAVPAPPAPATAVATPRAPGQPA